MKSHYLYKGHFISRCAINSSGMKYLSMTKNGIMKSDTLKGIKKLISANVDA